MVCQYLVELVRVWCSDHPQPANKPSQPAIALPKNTNKYSLHDPPGIVIEIVGTDAGERGRTCEEHPVNCVVVLEEDVVAPYFFY